MTPNELLVRFVAVFISVCIDSQSVIATREGRKSSDRIGGAIALAVSVDQDW